MKKEEKSENKTWFYEKCLVENPKICTKINSFLTILTNS